MFKSVSSSQFLASIRSLDPNLANIRISSVKVDRDGREIVYEFICDKPVGEDLRNIILKKAEEISPPAFSVVKIIVKKIVSNPELINVEIFKYITENYPSISIFLKQTDVVTSEVGDVCKYVIRLTKDGADYVVKSGIIKKLNDFLSTKFCSDFAGGTEIKEIEETFSLLSDDVYEGQVQKIEHRTIKVEDMVEIDDPFMDNIALYIEDAVKGSVTVCGNITEIAERETKNGKPFFIIHLDDTTGRISGVYFTKKTTLSKIRELKIGDTIIASGNIGEYNGRTSFTYDKINRCTFPKNFVKKDKFKKQAPLEYSLIFPKPATITKIKSVFDEECVLPQQFFEEDYVVIDLETTGTEVMNSGITEIGAVKISKGKITEEFSTLVKPDYPISDRIVEITGITEEMVKDAPKISAVIPDLMKFIDGTVLVAHNASFDLSFIKRFASAEEYDVKNKVIDTLELSRAVLTTIRKHDLHTIADHFGIEFRHHRALSDAYATAEAFIELMKLKEKKEKI